MSLSEGLSKAIGGVILFVISIIVIAIITFNRNRNELYREIEQMHQQQNQNPQQDPRMNDELRKLYYDIKVKKIILWVTVIIIGVVLFHVLKVISDNTVGLGYIFTCCFYFYIGVIAPIIIVIMSNRISVKGWEKLMEKQKSMNQNPNTNQNSQYYNQPNQINRNNNNNPNMQ